VKAVPFIFISRPILQISGCHISYSDLYDNPCSASFIISFYFIYCMLFLYVVNK